MELELVRLTTAGSVDDGKSTLIGRLLFDCNAIFQDQLEAVKKASKQSGQEIDLSLITDGLAAEREQKITIDVAYRYFSTKKRRFIISDVPGHEQYTRNMVTGASTADIALILIDARHGVITQTKRHLFVASLLSIPHILVVVNKIDDVGYSQEVFEKIKKDVLQCASRLHMEDFHIMPISALKGDMVVHRGTNLNWYQGSTLYDYLENVQIAGDRNLIDFRFPVQYVLRPHQNFRGYAGTIESGIIRKGEKVTIVPSGKTSTVQSIIYNNTEQEEAFAPQSVVLTLKDERDISRGEMIVREKNVPDVTNFFEATVCWFSEKPMQKAKSYIMKHTTRSTRCTVDTLRYRLNIDNFHREKASNLKLNEIGRVYIKTNDPLLFDPYYKNKNTGGFIIIDEITNQTVGAGVIIDSVKNIHTVNTEQATIQPGALLSFTYTDGEDAQNSTIAHALNKKLRTLGVQNYIEIVIDTKKTMRKKTCTAKVTKRRSSKKSHIQLNTAKMSQDECVQTIVKYLYKKKYLL
ncbi:MAG TPA: GTP-binding protein [Patescibacteria group bacterium]|nr:GTP-binding protein [Patescibacteria group bacterium]